MVIINLKKEKKGAANMKFYYYIIILFLVVSISCKNQKSLFSTDNSGGYTIDYLPKTLNDSLHIDIRVFDLNTKQEINKGVVLKLYDDIEITNLFNDKREGFFIEKPFFTINAIGYKPIVTKPISFSKSNQIKLKVFLEPNLNNLRD